MRSRSFFSFISVCLLMVSEPTFAAQSTFEEFISLLGGKIPAPPTEIIRTLESKNIQLRGAAIIPFGRSLERSVTSLSMPRTVFAFYLGKGDATADPSRFIFLGYTPSAEQLEIIAGTEKLPNEFFIVPDYREGNSNIKARKAPVAVCISCHQNGGPIFSKIPWSETEFEPSVKIGLRNELNLEPVARWVLKTFSPATIHIGDFDRSVRIAAGEAERVSLRPHSKLESRVYGGRIHRLNDPLTPRLTPDGVDPYVNPAPEWDISLSRDGPTSFPNLSANDLLKKYCAGCHTHGFLLIPPLPLADLKQLRTYRGEGDRTVIDQLRMKTMPPISSAMPSPEDRERMIRAILSN